MPIQAKLDVFQFSPHHTQNPSASVCEDYFPVSKMGELSGVEKPPDAEKLPDGRNFVPGNANAKLGSFGSRRRARNPSASACRIVLLNANPGEARCLPVLAAPHAEPKRFG
jgi:hypothetical protein